jgi:hypothetical protein
MAGHTAGPVSEFAALLDDIMAERAEDDKPNPRISVDYLAAVEELHSGRIRFGEEAVRAEYATAEEREPKARPARQKIDPPSIDPTDVARELGLDGGKLPRDLDRVRRDFAFRNHPDRVATELRERAMVRMQIANMLIDEAKRAGMRKRS